MNSYYQSVFAGAAVPEAPAPEKEQPPAPGTGQPARNIRIQQAQPVPGGPSAVDVYTYPQNLRDALRLIEDALNRETEDSADYDYLIANAPSGKEKDLLTSMRGEDAQNFISLRRIYTSLTGQAPPEPGPLARVPQRIKSFCDGLKKGLGVLEQESREYPKILYALQNRTDINLMLDVLFAEIRHYIQVSRMYFENRCQDKLSRQ